MAFHKKFGSVLIGRKNVKKTTFQQLHFIYIEEELLKFDVELFDFADDHVGEKKSLFLSCKSS